MDLLLIFIYIFTCLLWEINRFVHFVADLKIAQKVLWNSYSSVPSVFSEDICRKNN